MYWRNNLRCSRRLTKGKSANANHPAMAFIIALMMAIIGSSIVVLADSPTVLMHRVDRALRANDNLNGAKCYTASPGVIVLFGTVFDDKDRKLAEATAGKVKGVTNVVNTLRTETGEWLEEESRINDTLQLNGLQGVSARVVGSQVYLSGTVTGAADKQRASRVVASVSNLHQSNFIWVTPGSIF